MLDIDEDKLTEFTQLLAEFQTVADKTAAVDVYDRFTINKLEDYVVDLYQISVNASHKGLQFLCERMRDNIRDHLITGTNVSNDEFALMTEWKSLVKAYLEDNNNRQIAVALADNLAKPSWISALDQQEKSLAVATLLNEMDDAESEINHSREDEGTEFDAYMQDSNLGFSDVFALDETSDLSGEDDVDDLSSVLAQDNPSVVESFQALTPDEEEEILGEYAATKYSSTGNDVTDGDVCRQDEILRTQVPGIDYDLKDKISEQGDAASQITDGTVKQALVDELFVGDIEGGSDNDSDDNQAANYALVDELFVSDIEDGSDNDSGDNQAANYALVDELFVGDVEDDSDNDSDDSQAANYALVDELFVGDVEDDSDNDSDDSQAANYALADELFVGDVEDDSDNNSGSESMLDEDAFDADLTAATDTITAEVLVPEIVVSLSSESLADNESHAPQLVGAGIDDNDDANLSQQDEAFSQPSDESDFVDSINEQQPVFSQPSTVLTESEDVATVYIEPSSNEKTPSRSIIEDYVDVIAAQGNQADSDESEPEQTDTLASHNSTVKLESIETILQRYSDWTAEQKELLSLILTEARDIIEQQDDVLGVLKQSPVMESDVLDMVASYSEHIERMGSAAEMVGLDALQKLCDLIGFHFDDLARASTQMIIESEENIRQWPFVIYDYLKDIYNADAQQKAIEYISREAWARTIREDFKTELKQAFSQSTILVEQGDEEARLSTATENNIDISIPEDVQATLIDGLLQELPQQTETLSAAMQDIVKEDYLAQLEVAQRIAHTIKGAANTVGIVGVATLTHQLEDILQALVKTQTRPAISLHAALVDAADCLEQMTECLQGHGEPPQDAVNTLQLILDWANYIDEYGPPEDNQVKPESSAPSANATQSSAPVETKPAAAQDALLRVSANMIDNLINQSSESIIANSLMHDNISRVLQSLKEIKKNRDDVYHLSQQLEHMIDVQGTGDKYSVNEGSEKFDPLEMDEFNELHTYSRRLIEATADSVELVKDMEARLYGLESVIADQSRAQKENQYAILKTRMAPVETIVARLKRGVRQSSKATDKTVELNVIGADTLLDNKILNNLVDPLMHLLRNAVDHGVESNETRQAQNKSLPATIDLSFAQVGERLEIVCQDDGQGLDVDKIKSQALSKGLIDEGQQLSEQEIYQIIMQHGFSTRDEVTQLSGRGVGMDVVRATIKELNGAVQIHSNANEGTSIEISLPVSLLSAHVLLIPSSEGAMAVSTNGVEEILQGSLEDLNETEQGLVFTSEQQEYPAVYLDQLLKLAPTMESNQQNFSALLIETIVGGKKVVLVNNIQSVKDIIIKPFSHYLPKVAGLIGATVLGNGDIATVVDVAELLAQQSELVGRFKHLKAKGIKAVHQASVLVVEDSISTRRSLAEFMQDLNYKVFTAKDGVEAIEVMREHVPSILLTDLEMPRMNGLELTSYVRSHDETKDIPIIMLTSRTTEKHKQEARSIGVDEYLTKPYVEDVLQEKVQHLSVKK